MTARDPSTTITTEAIKRFGIARLLVVGARAESWLPALRGAGGWKTNAIPATSVREAMIVLRDTVQDLVLLDLDALRASRAKLLHTVRAAAPSAAIVCLSRTADRDLLLAALHEGVVDVLTGGEQEIEFRARLGLALEQGVARRLRERRLSVLENACRRLSRERDTLNRQLGGMVTDLAQVQDRVEERCVLAAAAAELRTILTLESESDAMLKLAAQAFVLRAGASNCAVFVGQTGGTGGAYELCGYLRDDASRSAVAGMLDTICEEWCARLAMHAQPVLLDGTTVVPEPFNALAGVLPGRTVFAVPCRDGASRPAVLVLFRDADRPFSLELSPLLDAMGEAVACCLNRMRRIHRRAHNGDQGKAA